MACVKAEGRNDDIFTPIWNVDGKRVTCGFEFAFKDWVKASYGGPLYEL